jgi:hypothetical protein
MGIAENVFIDDLGANFEKFLVAIELKEVAGRENNLVPRSFLRPEKGIDGKNLPESRFGGLVSFGIEKVILHSDTLDKSWGFAVVSNSVFDVDILSPVFLLPRFRVAAGWWKLWNAYSYPSAVGIHLRRSLYTNRLHGSPREESGDCSNDNQRLIGCVCRIESLFPIDGLVVGGMILLISPLPWRIDGGLYDKKDKSENQHSHVVNVSARANNQSVSEPLAARLMPQSNCEKIRLGQCRRVLANPESAGSRKVDLGHQLRDVLQGFFKELAENADII